MSLEVYSNAGSTTLAANVDGTSNPVTISVTSAVSFPSTGEFRILIDSEILLVTAVSGNSLTCSRAQEGSTLAAHTAPAAVNHILTAASLKRIIGEYNIVDLFANRPAIGVKGRRFIASDGLGGEWRDNGTSWDLYYMGFGPLNPNTSDFATAVNSTARWTVDTSKGLYSIKDSGPATGGEFNMARVKTAPATPWTMTVALRPNVVPGTSCNFGIKLIDSATGHQKGFGFGNVSTRCFVWNWASATVFNTTAFDSGSANPGQGAGHISFLRVVNDGTNLGYWWSNNFQDWHKVFSEAISGNYVANIDQVGIYLNILSTPLSNAAGGSIDFLHAVCG